MDTVIRSDQHAMPRRGLPPDISARDFEIIPLLRRYSVLLCICVAAGIGLAVLYYCKTPSTYESKVAILIENRRSPSLSPDVHYGASEKTIDTHVLIVKSPLVVNQALAQLDLSRCPSLRTAENPARAVRLGLKVEKAGDDWSDVVSLTYRGADAKECQMILAAVVSSYESFLGDSSQDISQETTALISQAKDDLMTQLTEKRERYDKFRQQAPLMWKDGIGVNPHRERQMEVEKKRSEILLEHSTLSAKVKNIMDALRVGGERSQAVYYEAVREIQPEMEPEEDVGQRRYTTALADELVKLRAEEHGYAVRFGEGHPDLVDVRRRIKILEESLGLSAGETWDEIDRQPQKSNAPINFVSIYVNTLNGRLSTAEEQLAELDRVYAQEQEKANSLQKFQMQDEAFRKDLEGTQRLFDAVVSRLEEISIIRDHGGDTMKPLANPELGYRVAPTLVACVVPGAFMGLLAGLGLSYVFEKSSATFRSPEEIRSALKAPVIGRIPVIDRHHTDTHDLANISAMICTVHRHGSSIAESYRAVRTSLYYSTGGQLNKVIQVTSPLPGDGKSTLAANLAVTIAKSGKHVLIIDADFRKPTLHQLFGINAEHGLVSVVRGTCSPMDAIIRTDVSGLSLLPVTQRASNPAELLTTPEFRELLVSFSQQYDFVIVDTPPLLAVTDPSAVAAQVDGVLLVLRIRRGVQIAATRAREMLADVDANLLGVVVNAVDKKSGYGRYGDYGYGYGYGYTTEGEDGDSPLKPKRTSQRLTLASGQQ